MTREQPVVSNARWWRHDSCRCTLSVSTRRPASVALARLSIYNRRYSLHIVLRDPTAPTPTPSGPWRCARCGGRRSPRLGSCPASCTVSFRNVLTGRSSRSMNRSPVATTRKRPAHCTKYAFLFLAAIAGPMIPGPRRYEQLLAIRSTAGSAVGTGLCEQDTAASALARPLRPPSGAGVTATGVL